MSERSRTCKDSRTRLRVPSEDTRMPAAAIYGSPAAHPEYGTDGRHSGSQ